MIKNLKEGDLLGALEVYVAEIHEDDGVRLGLRDTEGNDFDTEFLADGHWNYLDEANLDEVSPFFPRLQRTIILDRMQELQTKLDELNTTGE